MVVTAISAYEETSKFNVQMAFTLPTFFITNSKNEEPARNNLVKFRKTMSASLAAFGMQFINTYLNSLSTECEQFDESGEPPVPENTTTSVALRYDRAPTRSSFPVDTDLECVNINPSSEKTIKEVLEVIIQMSENNNPNRKWILCVSDGSPFTADLKIVQDTMFWVANGNINRAVIRFRLFSRS